MVRIDCVNKRNLMKFGLSIEPCCACQSGEDKKRMNTQVFNTMNMNDEKLA